MAELLGSLVMLIIYIAGVVVIVFEVMWTYQMRNSLRSLERMMEQLMRNPPRQPAEPQQPGGMPRVNP